MSVNVLCLYIIVHQSQTGPDTKMAFRTGPPPFNVSPGNDFAVPLRLLVVQNHPLCSQSACAQRPLLVSSSPILQEPLLHPQGVSCPTDTTGACSRIGQQLYCQTPVIINVNTGCCRHCCVLADSGCIGPCYRPIDCFVL